MSGNARPVRAASHLDWLFARRREGAAGLLVGLVAALVLHVGVVPAVSVLLPARVRPIDGSERGGPLRLGQVSKPPGARIQFELRDGTQRPKEDALPEPDPEPDAPGQVVALPPPDEEQRPDRADYASEWDQRVDRETRSRDARLRPETLARELQQRQRAKPAPASATEPVPPVQAPPVRAPERPSAGPRGPGRASSGASGSDSDNGGGSPAFAFEVPRQAPREELRLRFDADGLLRNSEARAEVPGTGDTARITMGPRMADAARRQGSAAQGPSMGQGLAGGGDGTAGLPGLVELTPSAQQLAVAAGAPAADHLPEVEVDAATRLNAWRWKHATFFNRIADAIRREWQGGHALTSADPSGRVYGFEDRMTVVQVTIDRGGAVLEVQVAEPSGALALDDEAVRAFRAVGPFSNPPPQLYKGRDTFTFQFGFNVNYSGRVNIDWAWRPN